MLTFLKTRMVLNKQDFYRFGGFELHTSKRALLRDDEKVALSPKSFEVLTCLVENAGRVVLKEELLKAVWPEVKTFLGTLGVKF